jgi:hypothetical protein
MTPRLDQLLLGYIGETEDGNVVMPDLHPIFLVSLPLDLGNTAILKVLVVIAELFDEVMKVAVRLLYVRHVFCESKGRSPRRLFVLVPALSNCEINVRWSEMSVCIKSP